MPRIAHVVASSSQGYAQQIQAGRHQVTADEARSQGGTDTGPGPYALLLCALGACTSITLRMYAERKGWELGEIEVDLELHKEGQSDRIARTIRFSAPLGEEQRQRLLEVAGKTPVTLTIRRGAQIDTSLVD